jgi:hypothetical protein
MCECGNYFSDNSINTYEHDVENYCFETIDKIETNNYGHYDVSELRKVKFYNDNNYFAIVHVGIYYDPNAYDSSCASDWYYMTCIIFNNEKKCNEYYEKMQACEDLYKMLKYMKQVKNF